MAEQPSKVRFRLIRADDVPATNPENNAFVFGGRFASGPANDRFVYLAWRSVPRGVWINRLKAKLEAIDWVLVRAA